MKLSTITFGIFTVLSLQLVWGLTTKDVASSSESSEETATVLQTQKRPKRDFKGHSLEPKSKKLYNKVKVDGPKKDNGIKEGSIPKSSRSLDRQRRAIADLKLSKQYTLIDKDLIDDIKKKVKGKWEDFKQLERSIMKLSTITFGIFTVLSLQLVWGLTTKDVASSSESSEETATVLQTQKRPKRGSKGYSMELEVKKLDPKLVSDAKAKIKDAYKKVAGIFKNKDDGIKEGSITKSKRSLDRQERALADLRLTKHYTLIDKELIDDIKKKVKGKWEDFKQLVSKS
ncbi:hypothetical protein ACOME3_001493 [Neoechinorhynchus agilis]